MDQTINFKIPGLILFDKDWTLVKPAREGALFSDSAWDQVYLNDGIKAAVSTLHRLGWEVAVISNQGGVHSAYKTMQDAFHEFRFLHEKLYPEIKASYFCPDSGSECWCVWDDCEEPHRIHHLLKSRFIPQGITGFRKPDDGMIRLAIENYQGLDIDTKIVFVGDRPEDQRAAQKAEVRFFWVHEFPEYVTRQLSLVN